MNSKRTVNCKSTNWTFFQTLLLIFTLEKGPKLSPDEKAFRLFGQLSQKAHLLSK